MPDRSHLFSHALLEERDLWMCGTGRRRVFGLVAGQSGVAQRAAGKWVEADDAEVVGRTVEMP